VSSFTLRKLVKLSHVGRNVMIERPWRWVEKPKFLERRREDISCLVAKAEMDDQGTTNKRTCKKSGTRSKRLGEADEQLPFWVNARMLGPVSTFVRPHIEDFFDFSTSAVNKCACRRDVLLQ
jgi:hypothetical protein